MQRRIDEAAVKAGRDPADIRRMVNLSGSIGEAAAGDQGISGSADDWVELLSDWATTPGTEQVERFATQVAPRVRAAVAARRGG